MEHVMLERLLEIALYSAAVFLAVLLFRLLLKRWLSPMLRYGLWFLVLLRLMVPVTFESGLRLITLPQPAPAATAAPVEPTAIQPVGTGGTAGTETRPEAPAPQASEPTQPLQAAADARPAQGRRLSVGQLLLAAYIAGVVVSLAVSVCTSIRLARRIRRLSTEPGRAAQRLYRGVRKQMGVRRRIPLRCMPDLTSPALTAQLRPVLLIPSRLAEEGQGEALAFALIHELTHYRRGDHLVCLLLVLLRALWWFNPVIWLLLRPLRTDMEAACDAQAARRMDRQQKLRYANLLLEIGQEG